MKKTALIAALGAFTLAGAVAQGAIVIFQDGFEALTSGNLNGQGTWTSPTSG